MSLLRISLLGRFEVQAQHTPINISSPTLRMLLAYLVLHRDTSVSRLQISSAFWPESNERRGLTNLRTLLYRLRRTTDAFESHLIVNKEYIQWNVDESCVLDIATFEELIQQANNSASEHTQIALYERAYDLYNGALLPECYADWLVQERSRFLNMYMQIVESLAKAAREVGDSQRLIRFYSQLVNLDPYEERHTRALMELYWKEGRISKSIQLYEECVLSLREELGVSPESMTKALYEQILESRNDMAFVVPPTPSTALALLETPQPAPVNWNSQIPQATDSFVGREDLLSTLQGMLEEPSCRLLTLVGLGGVGKTRLAYELLRRCGEGFAQGVHVVSFEKPETHVEPEFSIVQQLQIPCSHAALAKTTLYSTVKHWEAVILLDGYEQLTDTHPLLLQLLQEAPRIKCLITSRRSLGCHSEWVVEVEGLQEPLRPTLHELSQSDAAQLLLERVRQRNPGFQLTPNDASHVFKIVHQVSGLPLGLELAATWYRTMGLEQLALHLESRPGLLTSEYPDQKKRHSSLKHIFESSCRLLSEDTRQKLYGLSIFRGEFPYERARDMLGLSLQQLRVFVEHCFLKRMPSGHFQMHGVIRYFAWDRLEQTPELYAEISRQYYVVYTRFLKAKRDVSKGDAYFAAYQEIEDELADCVLACRLAVRDRDENDLLSALQVLMEYYSNKRLYRDAYAMLCELREEYTATSALSSEEEPVWLVRYHLNAWEGTMLQMLGRSAESVQPLLESLVFFREQEDHKQVAFCLNALGFAYIILAEFEKAQAFLQESLERCREFQHPQTESTCLYCLGTLGMYTQDYEAAQAYFKRSLSLAIALRDPFREANIHNGLSAAAIGLEDFGLAEKHLRQSLHMMEHLEEEWGIAGSLYQHSDLLKQRGEFEMSNNVLVQTLELSSRIRHYQLQIQILLGLGFQEIVGGSFTKAQDLLLRGLEMSHSLSFQQAEHMAVMGLASIAFQHSDYSRALYLLCLVELQSPMEPTVEELMLELSEKISQKLSAKQYQTIQQEAVHSSFTACVGQILAAYQRPP